MYGRPVRLTGIYKASQFEIDSQFMVDSGVPLEWVWFVLWLSALSISHTCSGVLGKPVQIAAKKKIGQQFLFVALNKSVIAGVLKLILNYEIEIFPPQNRSI